MNNIIKCFLIIFAVCLFTLASVKAWAEETYPESAPLFTDQELDDILAPVALYPDPLLAQILPASTYTGEIADAYDWQNSGGAVSEIDLQEWDDSVKAIARYPDILKMMAESGDWTAVLGDAFLDQPEDVTRAIQRLRWQARNAGNLASNKWQTVVIDGDYIAIIPAQPQYIYVPTYDPAIVYVERWYPGIDPFFSFNICLVIGSWLTMDFDWHKHCVIYHGWRRPGWVDHARPYVHKKNIYLSKHIPYINKSWQHDASHGNPDSFRTTRPGGKSGEGMKSRVLEIKKRAATVKPPKPSLKAGPAGDKRSLDKRGNDFSSQVNPAKNARKKPSVKGSGVSQLPASKNSDVNRKPQLSGQSAGKGSSQLRSAGEVPRKITKPSFSVDSDRAVKESSRQDSESVKNSPSSESSETKHSSSSEEEKGGSSEGSHSAPSGNSGGTERNSDSRGDSSWGKGGTGGGWRR
jgi:hypothetical protein